MILYVDGGCSGNGQRDIAKRKMVSVVADRHGCVVVEEERTGGSNNIAELYAVRDALRWCWANGVTKAQIRTDSKNNLAWVLGRTVGNKLNDRATVLMLRDEIRLLRCEIGVSLMWIPRNKNLAGHYIERKHSL